MPVIPTEHDEQRQDNINSYGGPRMLLTALFVLRLNVPVNNFSVMSGRSHRFLGN